MKNTTYDILNKVQRWIVALGVLYLAISAIWHLPYGDEVNQSIVAIATFIATILEISTAQWNKDHAISITDFTDNKEK